MKILSKGQKAALFICVIVIGIPYYLLWGYLSAADDSEKIVDWDKIKIAFDAFLEYPSPENAKAFCDTIPKDKTKNEKGDGSKVRDYIFTFENYALLENEIWGGNKNAIESAFRLQNITGGSLLETLGITLSTLVRINPRLFLEVLYEYKNAWYIKYIGYPVDMVGPGHIDRMKARIYELEMRVKALESVGDEKYLELRNACVRQLREIIKKSS